MPCAVNHKSRRRYRQRSYDILIKDTSFGCFIPSTNERTVTSGTTYTNIACIAFRIHKTNSRKRYEKYSEEQQFQCLFRQSHNYLNITNIFQNNKSECVDNLKS